MATKYSIKRQFGTLEIVYEPFTAVLPCTEENMIFCLAAAKTARNGGKKQIEVIVTHAGGKNWIATYQGDTDAERKRKQIERYKDHDGLKPDKQPSVLSITAVAPMWGERGYEMKEQTLDLYEREITCRSCGRKVRRSFEGYEFERVYGKWRFLGSLEQRTNRHGQCCQECLPALRQALHEQEAAEKEKARWGGRPSNGHLGM